MPITTKLPDDQHLVLRHAEERPLLAAEAVGEALMMGLRLAEGIDLARLEERHGEEVWAAFDLARMELLGRLNLVERIGSRIRVTEVGAPLLDAILGELLHPLPLAA